MRWERGHILICTQKVTAVTFWVPRIEIAWFAQREQQEHSVDVPAKRVCRLDPSRPSPSVDKQLTSDRGGKRGDDRHPHPSISPRREGLQHPHPQAPLPSSLGPLLLGGCRTLRLKFGPSRHQCTMISSGAQAGRNRWHSFLNEHSKTSFVYALQHPCSSSS